MGQRPRADVAGGDWRDRADSPENQPLLLSKTPALLPSFLLCSPPFPSLSRFPKSLFSAFAICLKTDLFSAWKKKSTKNARNSQRVAKWVLGIYSKSWPTTSMCSRCLSSLCSILCKFGYASIKAIETKSRTDDQQWLTYWVLYSLITLFELTFAKLLEWFPIWPYAKLIFACWLVLPHFNGAAYVYKHFIRPFYRNPQCTTMWYVPRNNLFHKRDDVLTAAERYMEEHGTEAFERLISKSVSVICRLKEKLELEERTTTRHLTMTTDTEVDERGLFHSKL
ncbi:HVA22-like protein [Psidium guajava]|nr:HVA22-like protein [Psidium guajava]